MQSGGGHFIGNMKNVKRWDGSNVEKCDVMKYSLLSFFFQRQPRALGIHPGDY